MIGSLRALAVLGGLAVLCLVVVLVDNPRAHAPLDRRLLPGIDVDQVTAFEVSRPGQPPLAVTRMVDVWRVSGGFAEPLTVDAVLATLRGGRWHRRAERARAGASRATLRVFAGNRVVTLDIGQPLPGTGQTWIARDDTALLVDDWVANALAPEPLALHIRRPLSGIAGAKELTSPQPRIRLEGGHLVEPVALWVDPTLVDELYDACENLEIRDVTSSVLGMNDAVIQSDRGSLAIVGACRDGLVLISTEKGQGCVDVAAVERVRAALTAFTKPPAEVADKRPLPFAPTQLDDLDLAHNPDLDPTRVVELVAALNAPAEIVARPAGAPTRTLVAKTATTAITLELFAGVLARKGEPIALRPTRDAWAVIARGTAALRDTTLWREDAISLASLAVDGITYQRGAVLGEWTRQPPGTFDIALVEAAVEALATVRAPAAAAPTRVAHRVSVTFAPPTGKPVTHQLDLAAPTASGCSARADGTAVVLPLPLCTAVHALAASR